VSEASVALPPLGPLTAREREVLSLLAEGLTNAQIAQRIWISKNTVSVHVARILWKLDAGNRTQAVSVAIRHGLVSYE
jgi:DNA-binding NarL/FixJ family response regulator